MTISALRFKIFFYSIVNNNDIGKMYMKTCKIASHGYREGLL
jgi:hypothetical protein